MLTEPALQVLLALASGPAHGYAIGKDIAQRSDGRYGPTTGSLYQVLRRLTADGLIESVTGPEPEDAAGEVDARRKYFAITVAGRAAAMEEIGRLDALVRVGRRRQLFGARAL